MEAPEQFLVNAVNNCRIVEDVYLRCPEGMMLNKEFTSYKLF